MIFLTLPTAEALDVVLAHAVRLGNCLLPKGRQLTNFDIQNLMSSGIASIVGAKLEASDVLENDAAEKLAQAVSGPHLRMSRASTGRVNLYSLVDGLFVADKGRVDRLNAQDPAITFACLADHTSVSAGDMVGTFKIIPLAVSGVALTKACTALAEGPVIRVKPYLAHDVQLIATTLPSLKKSVMDKTARVLSWRLEHSGSKIEAETRVQHATAELAVALGNVVRTPSRRPRLVVIFGASAVTDCQDVIPSAIRSAGGTVVQVGIPVDPGNLLVYGTINSVPVVGAPGCARSPKENGFDWILDRLLAGEEPTVCDFTSMGVGGLLMEISSRPRPRETPEVQLDEMPHTAAT